MAKPVPDFITAEDCQAQYMSVNAQLGAEPIMHLRRLCKDGKDYVERTRDAFDRFIMNQEGTKEEAEVKRKALLEEMGRWSAVHLQIQELVDYFKQLPNFDLNSDDRIGEEKKVEEEDWIAADPNSYANFKDKAKTLKNWNKELQTVIKAAQNFTEVPEDKADWDLFKSKVTYELTGR